MSAITTLAVTVAAAAGGLALYRFVDRRHRALKTMFEDAKARAAGARDSRIIDYERDPESGVFRPKK